MIEQALKESGQPVNPVKPVNKKKEETHSEEDRPPKTKRDKVKENLKKRQKYDPRKAVEAAKRGQQKEEKEHKSAFPEGMFAKTPRD
jgi:hypothetical protein